MPSAGTVLPGEKGCGCRKTALWLTPARDSFAHGNFTASAFQPAACKEQATGPVAHAVPSRSLHRAPGVVGRCDGGVM